MPEPNSGCWLWIGCVCRPDGYGRIGKDGKTALAHRVSYELHKGPIPVGLEIDHLCRNRQCVNPAHLEAVTRRVNILRGIAPLYQRSKTHCPRGHELSGDNLLPGPAKLGYRGCRECMRRHGREFHRRKREEKWARHGRPEPTGKRVVIEGVEYPSMYRAAKETGLPYMTIVRRVNRGLYLVRP